ncbi:Amidase [Penicillium concentricum]|uniref:amidase n=1 Tax=Penicillium concentricum TaxID=293559 RepID=A0A9W9SSJ9_9EURO|nr:Amidase [Penicillium concentricum]KAJ5383795.1 Amidase [Penicillium concentricum]
MTGTSWELKGEAKRQSILNAIPEKWRLKSAVPPATELRDVTGDYIRQYLTEREIEITETDAVGIVDETSTGRWSAVEVTAAFCHRAALAHQLVGCLHEVFFEAAIEDAKQQDEYFAKHKTPIGPLHGLPVSLKDQFHVKGVETTMGYVGWINTFQGQQNDPRSGIEESELVRELRSLGAVLYCKTSVPATLMAGETINHIIGYTWNPKNRLLSCGGSSGGEGALMALRGSPAGFGTDIGGSVRIPAGFNFLYGLRPSAGRIPYQGAANSMDGQGTILSVIGPIAPTARSLTLLFKAVLSQKPWLYDPLALELPWRDEVVQETRALIEKARSGSSTLAFGIMKYDGVALVHPPIARGLKIVEKTLKRLGHRVIEWKPPSHAIAAELVGKVFNMDGGVDLKYHFSLSGESPAPQVISTKNGAEMTASEIAALNVTKRQYQKQYMDYWNSTAEVTGTGRPVDGLFCPLAPHAAVIPNEYKAVGYTGFVNLLDYTSLAIPVTFADKKVDVQSSDGSVNDSEDIEWDYDAETYDGAPVGVQLVGRRLQEEKMLTLAEYLGEEIAQDAKARV